MRFCRCFFQFSFFVTSSGFSETLYNSVLDSGEAGMGSLSLFFCPLLLFWSVMLKKLGFGLPDSYKNSLVDRPHPTRLPCFEYLAASGTAQPGSHDGGRLPAANFSFHLCLDPVVNPSPWKHVRTNARNPGCHGMSCVVGDKSARVMKRTHPACSWKPCKWSLDPPSSIVMRLEPFRIASSLVSLPVPVVHPLQLGAPEITCWHQQT